MDITYVLGKMLTLFAMIIIGYIANKTGIVDQSGNKKISSVVINISIPCLMLSSLASSTGSKGDILTMLLVSSLVYIAAALFAKLMPKILRSSKKDAPIIEFLTIFVNNGFMGFPVIQSILGNQALIYASIMNLPNNIFIFSYGVYLFQKSKADGKKIDLKKIINPAVITAVITLFLATGGVKLPTMLDEVCSMMGNMATPLSMIVIGSSLAMVPVKDILKGYRVYLFSIFRLLILPALAWLILHNFSINPLILGVIVITVGMPCAANAVMMAEQYDADALVASRYVFITTLLSVVTIPLVGYVLFAL